MPSTDPIAILESDHNLVRELLERLERERDGGEVLEQLREAIVQHTELEEDLVYPAFHQAAAGGEHEHLYFEAIEEHGLVDTVLSELDPDELEPPVFQAKLEVMKELLLHHIEEEEQEFFPLLRKLCDAEQLDELGERLAERHEPVGQEAGERTGDDGRRQRSNGGRVDINRADFEELQQISGIDGIRAGRIIDYRESHGRFEAWEDLGEIEGFDTGMIRAIRDQASLG